MRETKIFTISDSNYHLFAKWQGALLRPALHFPTKGEEKMDVWIGCGSDLHKNSPGAEKESTYHQRMTNQHLYRNEVFVEPDKKKGW